MEKIRKNIIKQQDILYFDFTASGLAYEPIEKKIKQILKTYGNTHSEASSNAVATEKFCIKARENLRKNLQISDDFYIFPCGSGSTGAIKKFQELLGLFIPPRTRQRYDINPKNVPLVVVGPYEHHSNEISYRQALCDVVRIGLDENQDINFTQLENVLKQNQDREIIASFGIASNVTGQVSDYKRVYEMVKKYGGILALDGAASSAYKNVDCNFYDALFLSPHKLLGGVGSCGLLILRKNLHVSDEPTFAGGGTVEYVSRVAQRFVKDVEVLENAGTPAILQLIRASFAYELRNEIGLDFIAKKEQELAEYFLSKLFEIDDVVLYGKHKKGDLAIFSFNINGILHDDLAKELSQVYGIQTRSGCSCAGPFGHDLLGLKDGQKFIQKPGWLRISLHFTHTLSDIDFLVEALKKSIKKLKVQDF